MGALMETGEVRGHAAALMAAVLFGLMSPVSKLVYAVGHIDGVTMASFRIMGAALLFWLVSLAFPHEKIKRGDWGSLLGMSLCGMALNQYFYMLGVEYTAPTNACIIGTATPVLAFVLSALLLHAPISPRRWVGLLLAACGAVSLALVSALSGGRSGHLLGDIFCLVSQSSAAFYFVCFGRVTQRYHPITLLKWLFTMSGTCSLLLFSPHIVELPWAQLNMVEIAGSLYVVLFGTFFSYLLLIVAQRRLQPPVVATYNYTQPVVAAAVGILWGIDILTSPKVLSILLIALGVWLVSHTPAAKNP